MLRPRRRSLSRPRRPSLRAEPPATRSRSRSAGTPAAPPAAPVAAAVRVGGVDDVPEFMRVPHLYHGYRVNHGSLDAVASLFGWHLDTVNIWTHLLGFLYFAWGAARVYSELASGGAGLLDYVLFTAFLLGAQFQMVASAVYHTFRCVDAATDAWLLRLDLAGIASMILGSYMLGMGQAYVCAPGWSVVYLAILTLILAAVGFASNADFQHPKYDTYRNLIFGSAVGYSAAPVAHWVRHCDWQCSHIVAPAYLGIMGLYFAGYLVFLSRFPERWFRGFDTIGASHQIWHAFVWAAGALWLEGMLEYRRWRVAALPEGHCHAEYIDWFGANWTKPLQLNSTVPLFTALFSSS